VFGSLRGNFKNTSDSVVVVIFSKQLLYGIKAIHRNENEVNVHFTRMWSFEQRTEEIK
jgi:hypothetical protein